MIAEWLEERTARRRAESNAAFEEEAWADGYERRTGARPYVTAILFSGLTYRLPRPMRPPRHVLWAVTLLIIVCASSIGLLPVVGAWSALVGVVLAVVTHVLVALNPPADVEARRAEILASLKVTALPEKAEEEQR